MNRRAPLFLLPGLALLVACAAPAPAPDRSDSRLAYESREAIIRSWATWGLTGRLGVDGGDEGGSGRLDWSDSGNDATLRFRGALGQGAWRLDITPDEARLQRSDGSVVTARDVDRLVRQETGWELPVTALAWWVRGLAAPGAPGPERMDLNDDGTIAQLEQRDWAITYLRYDEGTGQALPTRLEAVQGDIVVKLAVSRWQGDTERDDG